MIIQHNLSALNTQNKLKLVGKNKMAAMEKLSSGYRINRAADDSAGLAISEKMRGQIRGLDRAALNTEEGISLVKVADGGLNEVHSIIQRQRELMVQAANDTNTDTDRQAIEEEVTALGAELDRLFGQTEYNTINIFKGHDTIEVAGTTLDPSGYVVPDPNPDTSIQTIITENITTLGTTTNTVKKYMPANNYNTPADPTMAAGNSIGTDITQKDTAGTYDYPNTSPGSSTDKIWDAEVPNPVPDGTVVTATSTSQERYTSRYDESESVVNTDELNHNTYENQTDYHEIETDKITHTLEIVESKHISQTEYDAYCRLASPIKNMVDSQGRFTLQNVSGDLTFPNPISQFSLEVDGIILPDIWNWPSITTTTNGNAIETTFMTSATNLLGHSYEIKITQTIIRKTGKQENQYDVTYSIQNNDFDTTLLPSGQKAGDHTFKINRPKNSQVNSTDGHGRLLCAFDDNLNPTGVLLGAGGSSTPPNDFLFFCIMLPIDIPYNETTTTIKKLETYQKDYDEKTTTVYTPQYLDIQVGANSNQNVPIRLWDLSTAKIKGLVPNNISAFNAQDSLVHLDRILDKMSNIRAYYGAQSNRLEHAYANDTNESENLQASESKIRDADMSDEMVKFAKDNILEQAGQAMLTQANNMNQGILQLLQ